MGSTKIDTTTGTLSEEVDLSNCDREPIHLSARVQSFGGLVAVSSDWIVLHASGNVEPYLGAPGDELLGSPFSQFLSEDALRRLRSRVQFLGHSDAVERVFGITLRDGAAPVDVALHYSGRSILIEFEAAPRTGSDEHFGHVRPMIDRIAKARDVEHMCEIAARQVRALTGFDRVMVYRFGPDGDGTVIAENAKSGLEPYLGLRYPASDIPKQARALYCRNLLRIIADVDDVGHPIEPMLNPEGEPLDLSMSTLRAVSPIHLEYLRNMGVRASMSISILKDGDLWGLIACHHMSPRTLPYGVRTAAELFAQLFALLLDQKRSALAREEMTRSRALHDALMAQLAEGSTIADNVEAVMGAIGSVIDHDGAVAWIGGNFTASGQTPTREEFLGLVRFLNRTAASQVFHTDCISKVYPSGADFAERAAGMLVLPVSRTPRDYIVLFRREVTRSVKWAGDPDKPVELGPNGIRLTPRKSFEAWQQIVRGTSAPWRVLEVQSAESLRITLLEVVLRMTDASLRERGRAQERQEILIAELNHRVRNILNLIRSLINQSRSEARSVADFTAVIGGRIHALARAHDQVTQEQWNPASLMDLIRTEADAFLQNKSDRVTITGQDALLEPAAFTTLALVVHELITNAAKHGALKDSSGRVDVAIEPDEDGAVTLEWREAGGPAISAPPVRRGFGSTIIERSVPFDLRGSAAVRYDATGLHARFRIPATHVAEIVDPNGPLGEDGREFADSGPKVLQGTALVVEDNMIIALDAEDIMRELGASDVQVATTVADGARIAGDETISFALLDVNLGDETSLPLARQLAEAGVPFAFATGYGEASPVTREFPGVPVVTKPYDVEKLRQGLREL